MLCGKVCIIDLTLRLEVSKHFVKGEASPSIYADWVNGG